jgi:hypothetical protein
MTTALLAQLIEAGVAAGEFRPVAGPELVVTCVPEIMWSLMPGVGLTAPGQEFFRQTVLPGAAARL